MIPRLKHYDIKHHWYRTQLEPNNIVIKSIDSVEQLADILSKGLRRVLFKACRDKSMGWWSPQHLLLLHWLENS